MARQRRGNLEGNLRQRPNGLWEARAVIGTTRDGSGRRRSFYGHTRKEVLERLQDALGAERRGISSPAGNPTVAAFLNEWLQEAERALAPKTFRRYRELVEQHIVPEIGRIRLVKLSPHDVTMMMRRKQDTGLAPRTVHHMRAVLRHALNVGIRRGELHRNAAALAEPVKVTDHEVSLMPPEEARAILAAFSGHPLEPVVALALWTGLRQAEILGLRWRDVDLGRRRLTVAGSLQRLEGEWRLAPPKTRRSARIIALPEPLIPVLAAYRDWQAEQRAELGAAWSELVPGLMFTTAIGTPLTGTTITNRFQWTLKNKGLTVRRFHDLRHGCATLLLASGVDLKTVSAILGHSTIAITANTYAGVLHSLHADAADRIAQLLASSSADQKTAHPERPILQEPTEKHE
ncbi:MAG: site-specific integrase [Candidatus Dormibacteraeota bacterium]|nr:site-specific integrase [Candidatus Dormibacteraeota bacterium]